MTRPRGSVSAMQQGEVTEGPGGCCWTVPHRQAALPRQPWAHLEPPEVPVGPQLIPGGRGRSQPRRCRQRQRRGQHFFCLRLGAHPVIQK